MNEIYSQIHNKILQSKNIALVSHRFPDWDSLWSLTAMYNMINNNFDKKNIDMICYDNVAEKLSFLSNSDKIINKFDWNKYDLCIFLDIWNIILAWFWEKEVLNCNFLINIDHHQSNIWYWDINLVDIKQPATAALIYDFFITQGYIINQDIATSLLTWIYTDTWAFIYSNVLPSTFRIASRLVELWWNIELISSNFFLNNTFDFFNLFSVALERLKINKNWIAFTYLKKEDIINSGCKYEELDWIVWRLNMLDNKKYVVFIYEKWDIVKWSFRTTREDVDLTQIASKYNWWWHRKACWLTLDWQIEVDENNVFVKMYDWREINFLND